ncbi:hypothetical protein EJ994_13120 [Maribacter sp. MJ134]|uniref:hypothetical protein n=1 Tax=Maribacter sp. MJ134 TaxID=2496865 RepID=UPI000F82F550|nr:hypothetical protein [Maribacter sp. MJ134]AZQ59699.1 hypothetical protein EJ994_13120 [Maribacter sp. MJ134]
MEEKNSSNPSKNSDEIDLGQLFQMIGNGFNKLFKAFLRLFVYLKKNALVLTGLVVVGAGIGYGLNQIVSKKLKTEVIVKPQTDSKNYLYDVIDEIQANIKSKNTAFFESIDIQNIDYSGLEVTISKVVGDSKSESDKQYLELLQSFDDTEAIADIVRAELQNKSSYNHRITFFYKDAGLGEDFAKKVMRYINNNTYFKGLLVIYRANASSRIEQNMRLLNQVDEIIANYSNKIKRTDDSLGNDRIILDNQETVDITGLFDLKNSLIEDIEAKKIELEQRTEAVKIINFGKTQQITKSFLGKNIVLVPLLLVGLYFLFSVVKYLDRKSKEMLTVN